MFKPSSDIFNCPYIYIGQMHGNPIDSGQISYRAFKRWVSCNTVNNYTSRAYIISQTSKQSECPPLQIPRQYLIVPPFHTSFFKSVKHFGHSFAFDAPKIWNDIPHDVRSATSVASFRKKAQNLPVCKSLSAIASHITPVSP